MKHTEKESEKKKQIYMYMKVAVVLDIFGGVLFGSHLGVHIVDKGWDPMFGAERWECNQS